MKILLDTNILIPLEDTGRPLLPELAEVIRLASEALCELYYHPAQVEDVNRDPDMSRREITRSRLAQYQSIPSPPDLSAQELAAYGWRQTSDNDRIDNLLLHAVCRNATSLLVTEDARIHRNAQRAGVGEQVHRLAQFLNFLRGQQPQLQAPYAGLQEKFLHEIPVRDSFFDSLRSGYQGFDDWYARASQAHRKGWCVLKDGQPQALCICKEENSPTVTSDTQRVLAGKVLKICTFKVGDDVLGQKLGERMLYAAFHRAKHIGANWVYLHAHSEQHEQLIELCSNYGFEAVGRYQARDDVYAKPMIPSVSPPMESITPLEYAVRYYPHFVHDGSVGKHIIPIKPIYYNQLFPDTADFATSLFREQALSLPHGNTIKKAYLCNALTNQVCPGDVLLFYQTEDKKHIQAIGVAESVRRISDATLILPLVSKRTVYSRAQIENMAQRGRGALVITFRLMRYIDPISMRKIERCGVPGPLQTIRTISHPEFQSIMQGVSL